MLPVLEQLQHATVVAVMRSASADDAIDVAHALVEAGVRALEITFTTPQADVVIAELTRDLGPEVVIGAGTVLTAAEAETALSAGARFLVSPGIPRGLGMSWAAGSVPLIPGVLTPTELMAALDLGAQAVKIFPASAVEPTYLAALRGPFPATSFIPTGGVGEDTIAAWITAGALAVGVGGNLCPPRLGSATDRAALVARARSLVTTASAVKLAAQGGIR